MEREKEMLENKVVENREVLKLNEDLNQLNIAQYNRYLQEIEDLKTSSNLTISEKLSSLQSRNSILEEQVSSYKIHLKSLVSEV